ncbi:class I SAM-dependent methyltransferase [Kamptonema animale CS-326]|jgi:tellurite methyltransferase|uniref:class I SAM-dependent methyltransferase n=1 Tax=Kamptonema animale TaxID=92934 RepID=UPI00232FEFDE|nr:class I SAM-dependent methyltransferase [Kamptonema animale]MDB9512299.1 class I SAM-dependent methyltransferase [Kamptonema animale CS-326]
MEKGEKSQVFDRDWTAYYQAVAGRSPRPTLLTALARFEIEQSFNSNPFAIDLGCGDGRDTIELLKRGWRVLAIDGQVDAITRLRNRLDVDFKLLETRVERFELVTLPDSVDLVNASFSLPFCPPANFSELWEKIATCLREGGRFSGHFFGERDSWADRSYMTHVTRKQLTALLQNCWKIEVFEEEEHLGTTPLGEERYWHIFHIVARKHLEKF